MGAWDSAPTERERLLIAAGTRLVGAAERAHAAQRDVGMVLMLVRIAESMVIEVCRGRGLQVPR